MTLSDILTEVRDEDILTLFESRYSRTSIENYRRVLRDLRARRASVNFSDNVKLYVKYSINEDSDLGVYIYDKVDVGAYDYSTNDLLLMSTTPRDEWVSMPIVEKSLEQFSKEEFIYYVVLEMTFYGIDESNVQDYLIELDRACKELQEEEEEGLITLQELEDTFNLIHSDKNQDYDDVENDENDDSYDSSDINYEAAKILETLRDNYRAKQNEHWEKMKQLEIEDTEKFFGLKNCGKK